MRIMAVLPLKFICLVALALMIASVAVAAPEPVGEEAALRLALVVGINDFDNLPALEAAVRDAEAVAKVLSEHGRFAVTLVTDRTTVKPSARALKALIAAMLKRAAGRRCILILYFASHGAEVIVEDPKKVGGAKRFTVLAASDSLVSDMQYDGSSASLLSLDALVEQLGLSLVGKGEGGSRILITDSCRTPVRARTLLASTRVALPLGVHLLLATKRSAAAWETEKGGLLTQALVEGLSGAGGVCEDGFVDFGSLASFVARRVKKLGGKLEQSVACFGAHEGLSPVLARLDVKKPGFGKKTVEGERPASVGAAVEWEHALLSSEKCRPLLLSVEKRLAELQTTPTKTLRALLLADLQELAAKTDSEAPGKPGGNYTRAQRQLRDLAEKIRSGG